MSSDKTKLLLNELEAEVLREALELYEQMRAVPSDRRFEYRYRAARTVLDSLRQENRGPGTFPRGDDEEATHMDEERTGSRPLSERIED